MYHMYICVHIYVYTKWVMLKGQKNTKERKKIKTRGIVECFMKNYSSFSWLLKIDEMSVGRGRSRTEMKEEERDL